jgi:hypothetical protein
MARNCEPQIRDHVAMRMRRRAEIQKREAEATDKRAHHLAKHPYYTTIQNVRFTHTPIDLTV